MQKLKEFEKTLTCMAKRVDSCLEQLLPTSNAAVCHNLNEAVRYSVFAGGKRIRPILCLLTAEAKEPKCKGALEAGCAYEMIHTYSLIHDDLPCMDNDDYRRGKPTNHKVFGYAAAVLAGDSLLTSAFECLASLADLGINPLTVAEIIKIASKAAGHSGMIGGQMLDLESENKQVELEGLKHIHSEKTGALITAPIITGALLAGYSEADRACLAQYAAHIGLLFQIKDDLLDIEGDAKTLGKATGRDAALGKSTFPAILGKEGAEAYALKTLQAAHEALNKVSVKNKLLSDMADFIYYRQK